MGSNDVYKLQTFLDIGSLSPVFFPFFGTHIIVSMRFNILEKKRHPAPGERLLSGQEHLGHVTWNCPLKQLAFLCCWWSNWDVLVFFHHFFGGHMNLANGFLDLDKFGGKKRSHFSTKNLAETQEWDHPQPIGEQAVVWQGHEVCPDRFGW